MVGQAIRYLLIGSKSHGNNPQYEIYNYVGDNVFPNVIPQNYGLPALVYTIRDSTPANIKYHRPIAITIDVEIDVIADNYGELSQISLLIKNNLHRYRNIYNSNDSDGIGFGSNSQWSGVLDEFGMFAPPSNDSIQYVGGLQIIDLSFTDSTESFDDVLENYRNTLSFKLTYLNDVTIFGADFYLKLQQLNLMYKTGTDPKYINININDGVNYLFAPSVLSTNISKSYSGLYTNFYESDTNRPTLKQSSNTPPKYNQQNYLEFGEDKYLSNYLNMTLARKLDEVTIFCVFSLPNSYLPDSQVGGAILLKNDGTGSDTGGFGAYSWKSGISNNWRIYAVALEDDGFGGQQWGFFNIAGWTTISGTPIYPNTRFSDPVFLAFSLSKTDSTTLTGQYDIITSSDFTEFGDDNIYNDIDATSSTTWKDNFFSYQTIHSDMSTIETGAASVGIAGDLEVNDPINVFDLVVYPKKLVFGSPEYMEIKKQVIEKHNMLNRTTN